MDKADLKKRIVANAYRIISESGISQRALARKAGVPYHVLCKCIDPRTPSITSGSMVELADILGVDPHELTTPLENHA